VIDEMGGNVGEKNQTGRHSQVPAKRPP
jgi:hypothetical protein